MIFLNHAILCIESKVFVDRPFKLIRLNRPLIRRIGYLSFFNILLLEFFQPLFMMHIKDQTAVIIEMFIGTAEE